MDISILKDNFKRVFDTVSDACARSRRSMHEVRLVAVTKTVDVNTVRAVLNLGQMDMGESRAQDLIQKQGIIKESLSRKIDLPGLAGQQRTLFPRWHMIGHLQRNKVKALLPLVECIHSVDSLRLAEEINTAAARLGLDNKVKILLQVNTSEEKQKFGLAVGAVAPLAEQVATLPNLEIAGLMTMAPQSDDPERSRFCFARLREIFEDMRQNKVAGNNFRHLSMGMSQDYPVAVEEGATLIRVGSTLFGTGDEHPDGETN